MIDIGLILTKKFLGSEWTLNGDTYDGLTWLSDTPKPSLKELEDLWAQVQYEFIFEQVERQRALSYQETSDPIFMQYQRGEATENEWLAAVEAVKDANPYPVRAS